MAGLHTALRLNAAAFSRTVAITGDDCPTQRPAARRPQEVTRRGAGPPRSRSPHWSRRLNGRPRAEPSRAEPSGRLRGEAALLTGRELGVGDDIGFEQ